MKSRSTTVSALWRTPLSMLFIDGGIIGPPPRGKAKTKLYVSGPQATLLSEIEDDQLRIRIVGDRSTVSDKLRRAWDHAEALTKDNDRITLAVAGMACLGLLWFAEDRIVAWLSNPQLADHIVLLGAFLMLMLVSAAFEIVMVARKRHLTAAWTYGLSDVARTILLVIPAFVHGGLRAVLWGGVAVGAAGAGVGVVAAADVGPHRAADVEQELRLRHRILLRPISAKPPHFVPLDRAAEVGRAPALTSGNGGDLRDEHHVLPVRPQLDVLPVLAGEVDDAIVDQRRRPERPAKFVHAPKRSKRRSSA